MKKTSTLIVILAITLAFCSAFTGSKKFATDWFRIKSSLTITPLQYQSDNGFFDFDDIYIYDSLSTPLTYSQASWVCWGLTYVCAASIPESTNNSYYVLEQTDLDYLKATRSSNTIALKYRN